MFNLVISVPFHVVTQGFLRIFSCHWTFVLYQLYCQPQRALVTSCCSVLDTTSHRLSCASANRREPDCADRIRRSTDAPGIPVLSAPVFLLLPRFSLNPGFCPARLQPLLAFFRRWTKTRSLSSREILIVSRDRSLRSAMLLLTYRWIECCWF